PRRPQGIHFRGAARRTDAAARVLQHGRGRAAVARARRRPARVGWTPVALAQLRAVATHLPGRGGRVSRLKIAHITTVDISLRFLLLNQLRSLQDAGYEVVGISTDGPDAAILRSSGIRHIPVTMTRNLTPLADLRSLWQLYRVMRRENFAIV